MVCKRSIKGGCCIASKGRDSKLCGIIWVIMRNFLSVLFYFYIGSIVFANLPIAPENLLADILHHHNFLLFQRGETKTIIASERNELDNLVKYHSTAKFDPINYFQIRTEAEQLKAINLTKAFIRTAHHDNFSPIMSLTEGVYEVPSDLVPVLHFVDGEKNHYLLKRIDDNNFDLVVFEYSKQFDHFSKKIVPNYNLYSYLLFACVGQNKILRIALYRESMHEIPMPTNLEIPIKQIQIDILITYLNELSKPVQEQLNISPDTNKSPEDMLLALQSLEQQQNNLEIKELLRMKELINIRLPALDLSHINNLAELNLAIQSEIIQKIFNPDPNRENCPGVIEHSGHCRPSGYWDEKTWRLYRRLYRIDDIAGDVFHESEFNLPNYY